jgi:O-antigen ligase
MANRNAKTVPSKKFREHFDLFNQLLLVVITATITTFPFVFDSFTVPKLFVLSTGLTFISVKLFLNRETNGVKALPKSLLIFITLFLFSMIVSWSQSGVPFLRGLFGQFGRGNGLFYYFFAILVFVYTVKTYNKSSGQKMHQLITVLSWFLAIYATFQRVGIDFAELDTRGVSPVVLTFGNSNFAGGMLSVLFAYHLTYVVLSKTYHFKHIALLVALIASSTFPAAVQGYLIILFSMVLTISILIAQKSRTPWITRLLISAWIMGIAAIILGIFGKFIFAPVFSRVSFQARIEYWRISLDVIRDYPIFGVGPDKLYDVTSFYMSPGSLKLITTTRMDNAHNWFLNLGANYGLISLAFLMAILGIAFFYFASHLKNLGKSDPVAVSASVAFVCMFIDGLVSLEQPGIGIWLYLFAGVAVGSSIKNSYHREEKSSAQGANAVFPNRISAFVTLTISSMLFAAVFLLGQRIYFDAVLRSNVQTALLNRATVETVSKIEYVTIKLKSDPEYSTQALRPLAALGDAEKIDSISKATYNYYPNSIQASLIRADVLRALNRERESCEIRGLLIENTPWDFNQLAKYIDCSLGGFLYPNIEKTLSIVEKYSAKVDRSPIASSVNEISDVSSRLNQAAVRSRTYFLLGKMQLARDLQSYGNNLLARLIELQISNPALVTEAEINNYRRLLDF